MPMSSNRARDERPRRMAINQMAALYKRAFRVLALGTELMELSGQDLLAAILRISCCDWSKRLRACHEHELSWRISFQFQDLRIDTGLIVQASWIPQNFQRFFPQTLNDFGLMDSNGILCKARSKGLARLKDVPYLFKFRSTSWAKDETICLAGIVGMSYAVDELQQCPEQKRMKRFLQKCGRVPLVLAFMNCRRLQIGWSWAPSSL